MTDIEGSTRLLRRLGEQYPEVLQTHRRLIRGCFRECSGAEVDAEGDALFFAFGDAVQAVDACVAAQRILAAHDWPPDGQVRVRIGADTGLLRPVGAGYVDLAVHRVARICAGAHGGQVLLSQSTVDAVDGRFPGRTGARSLGSFQLRGFPEPQRLFQLVHPDLRQVFPPLRLVGVVIHNLPFVRSRFVGRRRERAALDGLLQEHGLVTIVGLGGIGKTRLAVQLGFDVMDRFEDGVRLVELAALTGSTTVRRIVAQAFGLAEPPTTAGDDLLVETLRSKNVMLLLDSCERHLDAVAAVVDELLRNCPNLQILATSREPLGAVGEVVWRLAAMPTADPDAADPVGAVAESDALDLFLERARSAVPQVDYEQRDLGQAARIVHRVGGIPLAVELAAAALSDWPLAGLLDALTDRVSMLSLGRRGGPQRHETLRAALEWSLDLLPDDERRLFRRLAVFVGGATTTAIAAVCGGGRDLVVCLQNSCGHQR